MAHRAPCFWTASAIDARYRETMRWLAGDDATTTRGPLGATTHTEAVATTAERTAVLPLNRQALGSSAGPSALPFSRPVFGNQPIS